MCISHIQGRTFHGRHGQINNRFSYGVDYILTDFSSAKSPLLFSRNRFNLAALYDRDHGGPRGAGLGANWVRAVLCDHGFTDLQNARISLLAQPRMWGFVFNPVSFWLIHDLKDQLLMVIAEVNNTFGDRHSYLCYKDDLSPITRTDTLHARKVFHVSPFQDVAGDYTFRFDITDERIGIWIDYRNGSKGILATYNGRCHPISNASILSAAIGRPFGALRVLGLIYWQAVKLRLKGALFRPRPLPPSDAVSR